MPSDALLALAGTSAAPLTKTATFNGTAVILAGGTPRRGLVARVIYSAAQQASGSGVYGMLILSHRLSRLQQVLRVVRFLYLSRFLPLL